MREKLLDAAEALVQSRGLNAVTFQDIADAVGLRKPSVFHHIKNKDELAEALIQRCSTKYGPQYVAIVEKKISAPEKLRQVAKVFETGLKHDRPCLLAALSGSPHALASDATANLKAAAEGATERFSMIFAQGRKEATLDFEGTANHAAFAFLGMLQGLQTLCRVQGDTRAFKKAVATYIDSITADA